MFLVNFSYENYMTYTDYISLVEAIMRHQKFLLTYRELSTVTFSTHVKFYHLELLTSVVFTVNRYKCFMENEKITGLILENRGMRAV